VVLIKIFKAFRYSIDGLRTVIKERAFAQELLLIVLLSPIFFIFSFYYIELILMIFSLIFILVVEVVNSAIETIINRISEEKNPLSRKAKDLGSLAVLLSFINFAIIWGVIIFGKM
jgi:diacylglycerol kinase (ATP)